MNRIRRSSRWPLSLLLAFIAARATASYNANVDFVPGVVIPNGVWTYGYTTTLAGPLINFAEYFQVSNAFGLRTDIAASTPTFFKVTSGVQNGVAAGQTALHGGPNGEYAVLRFVAPTTGLYHVDAAWLPGNVGDADLSLRHNGASLGYAASTNTAGNFEFSNVSLDAGDTIDLSLGTLGNFDSDGTPVNLVMTPVDLLIADFNGDGALGVSDFQILATNLHVNVSGLSQLQASLLGDITRDRRIDGRDFASFRAAYDEANGIGAFVAMLHVIPEPPTATLAGMMLLAASASAAVSIIRR